MQKIRRAFAGLIRSDQEVEAEQLQEVCVSRGGVPIADIRSRQRVCVAGTLRSVTLRPRAGVPALEADLYDGSGSISICWLGRRRIPGVTSGREVTATGFVSFVEGRAVMFNPRYELRSVND